MAVYREMLSDWEYARRTLPESQTGDIAQDIEDLERHLNKMQNVWTTSVYVGRQVTRFKKPPQSGLKRKHEQKQK